MSLRSAALCATLVVVSLTACSSALPPMAGARLPPLQIEVLAHVVYDGTYDQSYIEPVAMGDICALKKSQFGNVNPRDVCKRPYEVNWLVVIDDPAGKCAGSCSVKLTRKGTPQKNANLFAGTSLAVGKNVRSPDTWSRYGWGNKAFGYDLQLKVGADLIGIKLDPDIMPHPPGG